MLKVREIADKCGVNRNQIYRFINERTIEPVKIIGNVRYYSDDVIKLFKQFKQSNTDKAGENTGKCLNIKQHSEQKILKEKIDFLQKENEFLKKQINEQNAQIKELHTLLHENNQALLSYKSLDERVINSDKTGIKQEQTEKQTEVKQFQTEEKDNGRRDFLNRILNRFKKGK
ncbi:hypothetical protein QUW37_07500 [Ligilactobacillus aviarius]|uniref:helix-turn-helix domain-containing protein n=1 Tax=Ligilactobacillus aviarius TaxID=1606 RepID=UPI0025A320A4|nr:helix-turn-helix domain-containing protein [Ligilactobacillus aviarius]MDM8279058.1 hypothetical protein [Ligilactobacillus aviarius]